jgi:hypothetical protein
VNRRAQRPVHPRGVRNPVSETLDHCWLGRSPVGTCRLVYGLANLDSSGPCEVDCPLEELFLFELWALRQGNAHPAATVLGDSIGWLREALTAPPSLSSSRSIARWALVSDLCVRRNRFHRSLRPNSTTAQQIATPRSCLRPPFEALRMRYGAAVLGCQGRSSNVTKCWWRVEPRGPALCTPRCARWATRRPGEGKLPISVQTIVLCDVRRRACASAHGGRLEPGPACRHF